MELFSQEAQSLLLDQLNRLIGHTEEIYLSLGRQFPELLREMEVGIGMSRDAGDELLRSFTDGGDGESPLGRVIRELRERIEEGSTTLSDLQQRDHGLFDNLDRQIGKLEHLEEMIDRIRDDSIEMELVSLNAMTVALKAGTAGRAFSYITEELKRLSARTIGLTEEITRRGNRILGLFRTFRSSLEELESRQERIFAEFRNRLLIGFDEFRRGVEGLHDTVRAISEKSTAVRQPLTRIMEEIQLQDIIRQSIDHVIISIEELRVDTDDLSIEKQLDELAFFRTLPDLCISLLDDIAGKIRDSLDVFRRNSRDMKEIVRQVEHDRNEFVRSATDDHGNEESLNTLFSASGATLQELLQDLTQLLKSKEQLSLSGKQLMQEVGELEERFRSFSVLVSRFHNIDIASRIEAAKQIVLEQMHSTVDAMSELTERIDRDVNRSLEETKLFIRDSGTAIGAFSDLHRREQGFSDQFARDIRSSYDQLFAEKGRLTELIGSFSLYTGKFLSLTESTHGRMDALSQLLTDIQRLRESLKDVRNRSEQRMAELLARTGRPEWKLTDERLKDIIRRFTIFTHKQTAGELAGFQVEQGVAAGEVTLFS